MEDMSLVFLHVRSIKIVIWKWFCFAILYHLHLKTLLNQSHRMANVRVLWTKSELFQSYPQTINWDLVDISTAPIKDVQVYLMFMAYPFAFRSHGTQYCLFYASSPQDCLNQTRPNLGSWECSQARLWSNDFSQFQWYSFNLTSMI